MLADKSPDPSRWVWVRVRGVHQALADGDGDALIVTEISMVRALHVRSRAARPVVVYGDTVLQGGRQDRVVERTVVVAPGAMGLLDVRCVERKRWSSLGPGRDDTFVEAGTLSSLVRRRVSVRPEPPAPRVERSTIFLPYGVSGGHSDEQAMVWAEVDGELRREGVRSPTESYVQVIAARRDRAAVAPFTVPAEANGILVRTSAHEAWLEICATPGGLASRARTLALELASTHDSGDADPSWIDRCLDATSACRPEPCASAQELDGDGYVIRGERAGGTAVLYEDRLVHAVLSIDVRATSPAA